MTLDITGNQIGDACEGDTDGDGVSDKVDTCPKLASLAKTDFSRHFIVDFNPSLGAAPSRWRVTHGGQEVRLIAPTPTPSMLIGQFEVNRFIAFL